MGSSVTALPHTHTFPCRRGGADAIPAQKVRRTKITISLFFHQPASRVQPERAESSDTHSEVMADTNQITAMIHFLATKNKTIVGAAERLASPPAGGRKISCIAALGPSEHPPPSHTPCIIHSRSVCLTFIDLQLSSSSARLVPFSPQSLRLPLPMRPRTDELNHNESAAYPNSCSPSLPSTQHGEREAILVVFWG